MAHQARGLGARDEVAPALEPRLGCLETAVRQGPRPRPDKGADPDNRGDADDDQNRQGYADPLQNPEHKRRIVAQPASFTAAGGTFAGKRGPGQAGVRNLMAEETAR